MIKIRLFDLIIIAGMIISIALLYQIYTISSSEGMECQSNPLVYAAKRYSELNHADLTGEAKFSKEGLPILYFDKLNLTIVYPKNVDRFKISLIQ